MTLLRRFLRDHLDIILAFYLSTALVLALLALVLSYRQAMTWTDAAYALLLATAALAVTLAIRLLRRAPFERAAERSLTETVTLPEPATAEQELYARLLDTLYRRCAGETAHLQDAHRRHLAFMNAWVHQMKTPVSAISLMAQEEGNQGVEEESAKLADGLDLVLHMARLQEFSVDYHIRRVDLLQSLRAVINSRRRQFIRTGIFPAVEADGYDWTVLTDEKWNRFMLDQVISNALKYAGQSPPPGGSHITCRLRRNGDAITLVIADDGPGIPPEDLPRVFDLFFTGENGRRFGGATGVGLWLVKSIAGRLHHQVSIASPDQKGTLVTFTYPYESVSR